MLKALNLQRILLSLGMIVFVGALVVGATGAFFSDTETSTGNTFAAGALDLRVDSESHYNGMVCDGNPGEWQAGPQFQGNNENVPADHYPQPETPCSGTWEESDLLANAIEWRFFNFDDIKPGDFGENTISLHVYNNDAWGCFLVDNVVDSDVTCTEPESEGLSADPSCNPGQNVAVGELGANLTFDGWLDQGSIPGFQCVGADGEPLECNDPTEGDNIFQVETEGPLFWDNETVDEASEGPFDIRDVLAAAYLLTDCDVNGSPTGDTEYGVCHGLAEDGRMVGSTTYYFGLAWNVPLSAGNEIQTDQLVMDMVFEAAQHRNNANFQCAVPEERTTLTLAKTVIPANVAADSEYTLVADSAVTDLSGIEGSAGVFLVPVTPGTFALSESGGAPNALSAVWECSGNATPEVNGLPGEATVEVAAGENVVCVVTNTYPQ